MKTSIIFVTVLTITVSAFPSRLLAQGSFLVNLLSGRCIDVKGLPGVANRAPLQLYDCEYSGFGSNGSITDQRWEITPQGFIRNKLSDRCIDVKGLPGIENQAPLQLYDCEYSGFGSNGSTTDQRWY